MIIQCKKFHTQINQCFVDGTMRTEVLYAKQNNHHFVEGPNWTDVLYAVKCFTTSKISEFVFNSLFYFCTPVHYATCYGMKFLLLQNICFNFVFLLLLYPNCFIIH